MDSDLWSELPLDLLRSISQRLTRIDRLRFHGVCKSWRSSHVTPRNLTSILSSLQIPFPLRIKERISYSSDAFEERFYYLESIADPRKVCLLDLEEEKEDGLETSDDDDPSILDLEEEKEDGLETPDDDDSSISVDLLDFRGYELALWYVLKFKLAGAKRDLEFSVVPSVTDFGNSSHCAEVCLMGIYLRDLKHLRLGDSTWSALYPVVEGADSYVDVVYRKRKGEFFAVDNIGNVAIFDSSLNVAEVVKSPVHNVIHEKMYLLESTGELYLVVVWDRLSSGEVHDSIDFINKDDDDIQIFIFRLDDARKEWEPVFNIGDRVFIVQKCSSFAVSSEDFPLFGRNRVCFYEDGSLCVFNVETGGWRRLPDSDYLDGCYSLSLQL